MLRELCHSGCNIHMEGTDYNNKKYCSCMWWNGSNIQSGTWNYLKDYSILWHVILGSLPFDMVIDYEISRFQLTKATAERHGPSLAHLMSGHLWTEPLLQDSVSVIFLDRLPTTGKKAKPQRRCVMCSKWYVRKEPIHWCPDCEADLCLDGCFNP